MQKGQITLFVILGLLVILLIGFFTYIQQKTTQSQVQTTVDQLLSEFIEKNAIPQYVKNCLDTLSNEGVLLLAKQGGVLYQDQKGPTPRNPTARGVDYLPYSFEGTLYDVWYGIHDVEFHSCPEVEEQPPGYPSPGKNISQLTLPKYLEKCQYFDRFSGYYGINTLPKLCDPKGPNHIGVTQSKTLYKSCEPGSYGVTSESTIQYQLQTYIQNHLPLCANFSVFEDAYGNKVDILGKPNVTIIWGDTDFTSKSIYPFRVAIKGKEPVIKYVDFTQDNKLRIKKLHYYANEFLTKETQDLFYNIEKDHKKGNFYEESFQLEKIETPCNPCPFKPAQFDRLFILRDERSKALGQTLTFLLPVKNRRPLLDILPKKYDEPYNTKSFSKRVNASGRIVAIDYAVYNGTKILIQPQGYDADDDPILYLYGTWKQTQNSNIVNSACFNPDNPFPFTSGLYRFYNQDPNFCTNHFSVNLGLWTSSSEYVTTQQKASYTVTNDDIGLHFVNVSVQDPSGLIDYQEAAILVIPEEYKNLTNPIP
ncbi:MAG TPA: hypothetical protein VJG90_03645 [Candidatus Nanoarchaeia archaeon]|nr:hypothetical protein [Candidatus Nanoarchaeia archaeon]